jgi:hypothetical protein
MCHKEQHRSNIFYSYGCFIFTYLCLTCCTACQFIFEDPLPYCDQDHHCPASQRCDLEQRSCIFIKAKIDLGEVQLTSTDTRLPNMILDMTLQDRQIDQNIIDFTVDMADMLVDISTPVQAIRPTCFVPIDQVLLETTYTARSPLLFCHDNTLILATPDRYLKPNRQSFQAETNQLDLGINTNDNGISIPELPDSHLDMSVPLSDQMFISDAMILDQMLNDQGVPSFIENRLVMYRLNYDDLDQLYWEPICHNLEFSWDIQGRLQDLSTTNNEPLSKRFTFKDPLYTYTVEGAQGLWDLVLPNNANDTCPEIQPSYVVAGLAPEVVQYSASQKYDLLYYKSPGGFNMRLSDDIGRLVSYCSFNANDSQEVWSFTFAKSLLAWIQQSVLDNIDGMGRREVTELTIYKNVLDNMKQNTSCLVNQFINMGNTDHLPPERLKNLKIKALDDDSFVFCRFLEDQSCHLHLWSTNRAVTSPQGNAIYDQSSFKSLIANNEAFDVLDSRIAYVQNQLIDENLSYQILTQVEILSPDNCSSSENLVCSGTESIMSRGWRFGYFKFYVDENNHPKLWWFKSQDENWMLYKEK